MLGDGVADFIDGEVRQLELVAVGVKELAIALLDIIQGRHGRERGGGRGLPGGITGGTGSGGRHRVGSGGGYRPVQDVPRRKGGRSHCGVEVRTRGFAGTTAWAMGCWTRGRGFIGTEELVGKRRRGPGSGWSVEVDMTYQEGRHTFFFRTELLEVN